MHKLIMLVGLPGAGKTTWAKEHQKGKDVAIFSLDDIRKELKVDITPQGNEKAITTLHKRIKKCLKDKDCIYDSTNLSYKQRIHFLSQLEDVEKVCYVFAAPVISCRRRNKQREDTVNDSSYNEMLKSFYVPGYFEGWDEINVVVNPDDDADRNFDFSAAVTFDQKNPHHTLSLSDHMIKTADIVGQSVPYLYNAAYFHDIGKLLTQTVDDKGIGHYYNHENVGAYIYLTYVNPTYDGLLPALLINWHMRPSVWEKSESCSENDRKMLGDLRFEELQILHEADKEAK